MVFDYKKFNILNEDINYDWLRCNNHQLLNELRSIDSLFSCIIKKILKCPHCDGSFVYETDDREYCYDGWWMCNKNYEKHTPSKARLQMIEDIVTCYVDEYWDYAVYAQISMFECFDYETQKKTREFSIDEWEKETGNNWQEFVGELIKEHIDFTIKGIEECRKYRLLKTIFTQKNFI